MSKSKSINFKSLLYAPGSLLDDGYSTPRSKSPNGYVFVTNTNEVNMERYKSICESLKIDHEVGLAYDNLERLIGGSQGLYFKDEDDIRRFWDSVL